MKETMENFQFKSSAEKVRAAQFNPDGSGEAFHGYNVQKDEMGLEYIDVRVAFGETKRSYGGDWLVVHTNGDIGLMNRVEFTRQFVRDDGDEKTSKTAEPLDRGPGAPEGNAIDLHGAELSEPDAKGNRTFIATENNVEVLRGVLGEKGEDLKVGDPITVTADQIEESEIIADNETSEPEPTEQPKSDLPGGESSEDLANLKLQESATGGANDSNGGDPLDSDGKQTDGDELDGAEVEWEIPNKIETAAEKAHREDEEEKAAELEKGADDDSKGDEDGDDKPKSDAEKQQEKDDAEGKPVSARKTKPKKPAQP